MSGLQRISALTILALVAGPLLALSDLAPKEATDNSNRLKELERQPTEMARIQKAAESFAALPAKRREQILKLHRQLEQTPPTTQTRLLNTMENYVDWLKRLDPKVRDEIEKITDKNARLQVIRGERDKEWLRQQPAAVRKQIEGLKGDARRKRIDEVRAQDRQRRREWAIAVRFWDELSRKSTLPVQLSDLNQETQTYVTDYLLPRLDDGEKARLQAAEGHWPLYPQVLVELADKHPIAYADQHWPRSTMELTRDFEKRLRIRPGMPIPKPLQIEAKSGVEYAKAILNFAHKRGNNAQLFPGLWPIEHQSLTEEMQVFVDKRLLPVLDIDEKIRYQQAGGKWPEYPQTIDELAARHSLRVPWPNLPGPTKVWDKYR